MTFVTRSTPLRSPAQQTAKPIATARNSHAAVRRVNTGMTAIASGLPPAMPRLGSRVPTSAAGAASTPKT